MDRAELNLYVWLWAEHVGVMGLMALQTATHGDWQPVSRDRGTLRAVSPAMQWIIDKRDAELRERSAPGAESASSRD